MRIERQIEYEVKDDAEAIQIAKERLGADAVIISSRHVKRGGSWVFSGVMLSWSLRGCLKRTRKSRPKNHGRGWLRSSIYWTHGERSTVLWIRLMMSTGFLRIHRRLGCPLLLWKRINRFCLLHPSLSLFPLLHRKESSVKRLMKFERRCLK